jgi:hypothetical protein
MRLFLVFDLNLETVGSLIKLKVLAAVENSHHRVPPVLIGSQHPFAP